MHRGIPGIFLAELSRAGGSGGRWTHLLGIAGVFRSALGVGCDLVLLGAVGEGDGDHCSACAAGMGDRAQDSAREGANSAMEYWDGALSRSGMASCCIAHADHTADALVRVSLFADRICVRQSGIFSLQRCGHAESFAIRAGSRAAALAELRLFAPVGSDRSNGAGDDGPSSER